MVLEHLQLQSCSFFISLRSGVKLFGFLSLCTSIMLLLYGTHDLILELRSPYDSETNVLVHEWLNVIVQLVQSYTSMLLLIGVYQGKAGLMIWWLVSCPVVAILEATVLLSFIRHFLHVSHHTYHWYFYVAFTFLDDVFGWIVTFSHYMQLRRPGPGLV